jgi:hypothetical protein
VERSRRAVLPLTTLGPLPSFVRLKSIVYNPTSTAGRTLINMSPNAQLERLARWLALSAILSTVILVLHYRKAPANNWTHAVFAAAPFLLTLGHNAYFAVRWLQRRSTILRKRSDGANAWPTEPLFSSVSERNRLLQAALAALFLQLTWGWTVLLNKGVLSLRWPEDIEGMVLTAAYWLELVAAFYTIGCMGVVHTLEDRILCAHAHERNCKRCYAQERNCEDQPTLPTRPRVHPIRVLVPSMIFAAILSNIAYRPQSISSAGQMWLGAFAVISALAVVHRAYFILRILYAAHRRGASAPAWPLSPFVPNGWERALYVGGNIFFFKFYCFAAAFMFSEGGAALGHGPLGRFIFAIFCGLLIVDGVAAVSGVKMDKIERKARCQSEGHKWKCIRIGCNAVQTTGRASELADIEKKVGGNLGEEVCLPCGQVASVS